MYEQKKPLYIQKLEDMTQAAVYGDGSGGCEGKLAYDASQVMEKGYLGLAKSR